MTQQDAPGAGVRKAVIPVAGLGTRFLPATKAVPKELLPLVDTPAIEYVVAEASAAGIADVLFVTGRNKSALENHFDRAVELEHELERREDKSRLQAVRRSSELAKVHYVRQGQPLGLGHAILCAASHVGNEPFAVLLGDDLVDERDPLLSTMVKLQDHYGGSVIALMEVEPEQTQYYGCAKIGQSPVTDLPDSVVCVESLVEKPRPEDAPSNLAIIGRYVLHPKVFSILERTKPGHGGEIQITDALRELAALPAEEGGGVLGVVFRGRRYDTGDRLDYAKACVQMTCDRPDLGPRFTQWLRSYVQTLPDADSGN